MKHKLKFGLSQVNAYAPKWLINATSLLALFIAAKHQLLNGLPLLANEQKLIASAWVDYVLDAIQVLLAIAVMFFGEREQKNTFDDTAGNNHH